MKLYWTTTTELVKSSPEIFCYNLKADGMFIGCPGTLIFRNRHEAQEAIEKAQAEISKRQQENFDKIFEQAEDDPEYQDHLNEIRDEYNSTVDLDDDSIPMGGELI